MTGDLDTRRKRLRYRAARTGTRETDILLGEFVFRQGDRMAPEDVTQAERLLRASDADIANWVSGRAPVPAEFDTPFMSRLKRAAVARRR